jgi:multiple sugar transport system substrate-binding protein
MKKWNKLFALLSVALLVLLAAACGSNDDAEEEPSAGIERPTPELLPIPDDEQIILRYASWNLGPAEDNSIERQMIAAFMDAYPHIIIEIDESIVAVGGGADYREALNIAASTGDLPDVFMIDDMTQVLNADWVMDITDLANADSEFTSLPANIQDTMGYGGRVYAIPFAQHMIGFFVNRDLFDSLNLDVPTFGFSVEEMEEALRAVTDLNAPTIGTNHVDAFVEWYPGAVNDDLGFFTFDDENFHLDSDEMLAAIQLAQELNSNGFVFDELDEEQREAFNGGWGGEVFSNGQLGLLWDGTWLIDFIQENADFNWDFIGAPGGRPVVTFDILGISSETEHAEAAYQFARWMGSGSAGYTRRMELLAAAGNLSNSIPIIADQAVLSAFWDVLDIPGIAEAYEHLDRAMIDGNKIIAGWREARFYLTTGLPAGDDENATLGGFLWHSIRGSVNFADYASRLNELVQETFDHVNDAIE